MKGRFTGNPEPLRADHMAIVAALIGFRAWRSLRGKGNDERRQILDKLSGFLERHHCEGHTFEEL